MAKGKNKNKNTTSKTTQQNKVSQNAQNTAHKKFKLQPMDIVTIIFTAVIIGLMIFVVYNQFAESSDSGDNKSASSATSNPESTETTSTATPTATPEPKLSDIGNIYGNITNDASVSVIDEREYFISKDKEGNTHIYANVNNSTKDLVQTDASSLNVVTDYLSYTDQKDVSSYYVFYINGDGNICYVKDEPVGNGLTEITNAKEQVFLEGNYTSIEVSGEFVYHLDAAGNIGRTSIVKKETTSLSSKNTYSDFTLYFGVIYAKGLEDNLIYTISLNDSKKTETCHISTACDKFVLDDNWIYVTNDEGISRYSLSGPDYKESILIKSKIDAINVYSDAIFYIRKNKLYTCSAESIIIKGEDPVEICETKSNSINVSKDSIYLIEEDNKLYKTSYDKENKKYNEPILMN